QDLVKTSSLASMAPAQHWGSSSEFSSLVSAVNSCHGRGIFSSVPFSLLSRPCRLTFRFPRIGPRSEQHPRLVWTGSDPPCSYQAWCCLFFPLRTVHMLPRVGRRHISLFV